MKNKRPTRGLPQAKAVLMIFLIALAVRISMDVFFIIRFGPHATSHSEAWFYAEVMGGIRTPAHGAADPTVWMLRGLGLIVPEEWYFHAVAAASAIMSSLTAVGLYFLAYELYGDKAALAAGAVWATMSEPIALGIEGFTHDHLQLLLITLAILFAIKAEKSKAAWRIIWAGLFAVDIFLGNEVNSGIWIGFAVVALNLAYKLLSGALVSKIGIKLFYPTFVLIFLASSTILGLTVLKGALEGQLGDLPQGRLGSFDVVPTTASILWLRYNILLCMLPLAVFAAYSRQDIVGVALAQTGLILSMIMDRGGRISDLGFALLFALAASEWCASRNARKKWLHTTIASFAALFLIFSAASDAPTAYDALFLLAGCIMLYFVAYSSGDRALLGIIFAASAAGVGAASIYVATLPASNILTEAEYNTLHWLGGKGGGKVLTSWDRGHMSEYVGKIQSVSNAGIFDEKVHSLLWLKPAEAAASMAAANVTYVFFNSENYNLWDDSSGMTHVRISGGLLTPPKSPLSKNETMASAIYQMRYLGGGENFKLVRLEKDPATGGEAYLYRVAANNKA